MSSCLLRVGDEGTSASTLGMAAPMGTTNGACLTPRSLTDLFAGRSRSIIDRCTLYRELRRLVELVVERDGPHSRGPHRLAGCRVLARGDRRGLRVIGEVQEYVSTPRA